MTDNDLFGFFMTLISAWLVLSEANPIGTLFVVLLTILVFKYEDWLGGD